MNLREKLDSLNQPGEEHSLAVFALATEFGHSIRPLASVVDLRRYTCLVYALKFHGKQDYENMAGLPFSRVFAGKDFAHWLLDLGYLEKIDQAKQGAFVIYFDEYNEFVHIGVVQGDGRIISKWGDQGLFNHEIFEVPLSYGNNVSYFNPIDYPVGIELFIEFAKELGIKFVDEE
jgi:hypothetical protein